MRGLTLSRQGQSNSEDCSFSAGTLWSAPIKISYFLVILFIYNMIEAIRVENDFFPIWYILCSETLKQIVLLATILCHEFGHGKMCSFLGGKIEQILLWPFGGICFSSRPQGYHDEQKKLRNELKIAGAGPMTHFFQTPLWLAIFIGLRQTIPKIAPDVSSWELLIPFRQPFSMACFLQMNECNDHLGLWLLVDLARYAVQMNVMLFMFNVFFPMYPLDGSKIMSCLLMLCGASATATAKFLICTSCVLSTYFIYSAFANSAASGGVATGIMAYLGFMCLVETYRIYSLLKQGQLHQHPLFETARSNTYTTSDNTQRLNMSAQDDRPHSPYRPVRNAGFQPFSTEGRALQGPDSDGICEQGEQGEQGADAANRRLEFLDRLEERQVRQNMTAQEMRMKNSPRDRV